MAIGWLGNIGIADRTGAVASLTVPILERSVTIL
jgi:hypothetical protein